MSLPGPLRLTPGQLRKYKFELLENPRRAIRRNVLLPKEMEFEFHSPQSQKELFDVISTYSKLVSRLLRQSGISPGSGMRPFDHEVVLREAIKNAHFHGNKQDPNKKIVIFWSLRRLSKKIGKPGVHELRLDFRDDGKGLPEKPKRTELNTVQDALDLPGSGDDWMEGRGFGLGVGLKTIEELADRDEHDNQRNRDLNLNGIRVQEPPHHTHRVFMKYRERYSK